MFTLCVIMSFTESYAQTFAIKTGVNLSKELFKIDYGILSKDYKVTPRFQLGVTAEFPLTKLFSFEPGLFFSSKGYKSHLVMQNDIIFDIYKNEILNYIEIPLTAKATTFIGRFPVYVTFGPYIGIALNGKIIVNEFSDNKTTRNEYNYSMDSGGYMKRMDYGLQAGIGIEIHQFLVGLNYDHGISKINQQSEFKCKNRVLGVTVGYKFNRKKEPLDSTRL